MKLTKKQTANARRVRKMLIKTSNDSLRSSLAELTAMSDTIGQLPYPDDPVRTDATVYLVLRRICFHLMALSGDAGEKCAKHDQWLVPDKKGKLFCEACKH